MKIIGYVLKETEVSNATILCYKNYKKARDTYDEKFPINGIDLDEFQERTFLSCVDLEDCQIIYSGDVPKIK